MYSPYPSMMMDGTQHHPYGAGYPPALPHQYSMNQQQQRAFLQHHHMMMQHASAAAVGNAGAPGMHQGTFSTPMQRQRTATGSTPSSRTVASSWCPPHLAGNGQLHPHHHHHHHMMPTNLSPGSGGSVPFKYTVQPNISGSSGAGGVSPAAVAADRQASAMPMSAATAATTTSLADKTNPMSGKSLERELTCASKDELIQVLLDLSSCNADASRFIHSKAQLFALHTSSTRRTEDAGGVVSAHTAAPDTTLAIRQTTAVAMPAQTAASLSDDALLTPSKELFAMNDSTGSWQSRSASKDMSQHHHNDSTGKTTTGGGGSPLFTGQHTTSATSGAHHPSPIRRELQDRHVTPEVRAFSTEVHPCLRLYGACRHTVNCIFKTLPRNLCLHWVRGSCAGGADCGCVHRFPANCPVQVQMVFELSHGGDRAGMAKRAEAFFKASKGSTPEPSPDSSVRDNMLSLAATASPIRAPHEDDHEGVSTPRNDNQRVSVVLSRRLLNSATSDEDDSASSSAPSDEPRSNEATHAVARCLNDSFELAA